MCRCLSDSITGICLMQHQARSWGSDGPAHQCIFHLSLVHMKRSWEKYLLDEGIWKWSQDNQFCEHYSSYGKKIILEDQVGSGDHSLKQREKKKKKNESYFQRNERSVKMWPQMEGNKDNPTSWGKSDTYVSAPWWVRQSPMSTWGFLEVKSINTLNLNIHQQKNG